jgi:hypothetical protein
MPTPSPRKGPDRKCQQRQSAGKPQQVGAWLPWEIVGQVCKLALRPPSLWQVFLSVVLTACRFNGREAYLTVTNLTALTGLAPRTVKAALAGLIRRGLLTRTARYKRLRFTLPGDQPKGGSSDALELPDAVAAHAQGAGKLAPRRCRQACTSPTSIYSSPREESKKGPFTSKQRQLITDVLAEATHLLDADAGQVSLPRLHAARLGLPPSVTYAEALVTILQTDNRAQARDFVRAVLALRSDPRVQGHDLTPMEG